MKRTLFGYAVMGMIAGALLAGCEKSAEQNVATAKQTVGEATQNLKDAQTKYLAEWQTFKREADSTIDSNNKRIDRFKEKMDHAGSRAKAKYAKDVAALEQKNRDLRKKLDDYKDEGDSKWEEFKTNFQHDMDAIGKTMKDLFKDND